MADLNHVVLIGRLTRDAELKYTSGGQAVCKFSIAVNRRRKNGDQWEDEANFFDIVLWGRQGESLNQYLLKGKMVGIEGELRQDRWQQDGQNRSRVEIVANNLQLLGGSGGASGNGNHGGGYSGSQAGQGQPAYGQTAQTGYGSGGRETPPPQASDDGFADDVPF
ncbi:MAG: single-stranded DNA-binding protein [Treponema sp.]|jgi:single-strand DNA-binding protein|nr:single-stranded DNA-binding protein [Treponema sp.]